MCGRSSLHDAPTNFLERFRLPPIAGFKPRYNICPTQEQLTLSIDQNGDAALSARRWGLIPEWAADASIGSRMINARSESLLQRRAFEMPARHRRCVILADGYYEWMKEGKRKVPLFFHFSDNRAFGIAGLWDRWEKTSPAIESCTVVTTNASSRTSRYHERMPALLPIDAVEEWLDPKTRVERSMELLQPCEDENLECHEVSTLVNNPANDSPACIAAVEPANERRPADDGPLELDLF